MNPCGPLPTMLPMLSNDSTGSSIPQLAQTLSSPAMPPPSNFSPFGPAPPAFVFDCMGPATGSFIPVQISPRFQNPSPSPVPMVYATPSPLLMTPQQSTPSMTASDSTFFEVPPMVLSQSYSSTLAPPHATLVGGQQVIPFTISRTPERHPQQLPLSPNNSLTSPKTQIKFRERTPEAPFAGSQPTGYPPNYAATSNCYQQQRETTPEEEDFFPTPPNQDSDRRDTATDRNSVKLTRFSRTFRTSTRNVAYLLLNENLFVETTFFEFMSRLSKDSRTSSLLLKKLTRHLLLPG